MGNLMKHDANALIWEFGIPSHLKGYKYIMDGIDLAIEDKEILGALCKELYPTIAKLNHTSSTSVEKGIRDAIKAAWRKVNSTKGDLLVSFPDKWMNKKPTNKDFITTIIKKCGEKVFYPTNVDILH
ncbi:MAG: sporulation initiation factor Spo0A C-terminal domain-containing protein [Eubacteriales bacterium]